MPVICVLPVACCVLMRLAGVSAGQDGEGVKLTQDIQVNVWNNSWAIIIFTKLWISVWYTKHPISSSRFSSQTC